MIRLRDVAEITASPSRCGGASIGHVRSNSRQRSERIAYDVVPSQDWLQGWTVTCNGIPVRHFVNKTNAERFASDAEYRAGLIVTRYLST
jgi:hypothetical protein